MNTDRFIIALGLGVFFVWASSCIAQIIASGSYTTPTALHAIMGTIVGSTFAEGWLRRIKAREDKE